MENNSGDEYDTYDLSEFSPADFVHIDIATRNVRDHSATASSPPTGAVQGRVDASESGGPQIAVALEHAANDSGQSQPVLLHVNKENAHSPFERYRFRGTLSVSDLVGPAWCEVQFDYGLRQGRSRALADRPKSFVSEGGKVITVEKKVAEANEKVLGRGRSVHKELEREICPEEVSVYISTEEEYWAVRFINMLSCLENLKELGFCREMPVFGIVQDQIIIGIIDEVLLKTTLESGVEVNSLNKRMPTSAPGTPQKSKRRREPSPSELTGFYTPSPKAKARKSASPPRLAVHELALLDTKTRRSNSLPSDVDAFSSRMQLMLYHHLLSGLLSPTFSFDAFWEKVHVNPSAQLSDTFLLQSGLAHETDGKIVLGYPACLDDLVEIWRLKLRSLGVRGISSTLEIVYRTQPKRNLALRSSRPSMLSEFAAADQEAQDIARAIATSLRDHEHDPDLERAIAESLRGVTPVIDVPTNGAEAVVETRSPSPRADLPNTLWYSESETMGRAQLETVVKEQPATVPTGESSIAGLGAPGLLAPVPSPPLPQPERSRIIGRKSFAFDEPTMNAYVQDVLQWWRGERPPRGVDVENSRRCFSCEYKKGCEWREMKAKEAESKCAESMFRWTRDAGTSGTT